MEKNVVVGRLHNERGIRANHRGYPQKSIVRVFGGDTETIHGKPYSIQVSFEGTGLFRFTNSRRILHDFVSMVEPYCTEAGWNVVFFHNLNFDIRALFRRHLQEIYAQYNDIHFHVPPYQVRLLFGRVNTATITTPGGVKIKCLDSSAFCPPGSKSLEKALKIYGVEGVKMKHPKGLGTRRLRSSYFKKYAVNDAVQVEALGLKILDVHKKYDITPTVSLPMLAGKIFRHHFFRPGESYILPPTPMMKASEFAYHAGKNGFYVAPGVYENVYEYDLNSAFPCAMRTLPQMVRGRYERTGRFVSGRAGVYQVSGVVRDPKYPCLWTHDFRKVEGDFSGIWCTGFEVELMRGDPAYDFTVRQGWIWEPDARQTHNPLAEYVDHFWKLKASTPAGPLRDLYKNLLNSLYGKFAACVEKRPVADTPIGKVPITEGPKTWVAGSLYHPFLAAQITGYVRRELTLLEREGSALHSATDSIKSFKKLKTSDELGGLKLETYGRCYLFRTKLYLHFGKSFNHCKHTPESAKIWDGNQHLCKYALHGFKGSAADLFKNRFRLLREGSLTYAYRHMVGLREGFKRNEPVSDMITRKETLVLKI